MLNIGIITPGSVCVSVHRMNTKLPWVKLTYQISFMPMQINPQANQFSPVILRQHAEKQRQRQRAAEAGGDALKREKTSVIGEIWRGGNLFFSTNAYEYALLWPYRPQVVHMRIEFFKILFAL